MLQASQWSLVHLEEAKKNMHDFSCFVFGLYSGLSCGLLRCGLCGMLYIVYSDCGVFVDWILCM